MGQALCPVGCLLQAEEAPRRPGQASGKPARRTPWRQLDSGAELF